MAWDEMAGRPNGWVPKMDGCFPSLSPVCNAHHMEPIDTATTDLRARLPLPSALARHTSLLTCRWVVNASSARLEKPHGTRADSRAPVSALHTYPYASHHALRQGALLKVHKSCKYIHLSTDTSTALP